MNPWDIPIILLIVITVVGLGLYFLNRWSSKRLVEHNSMIETHKQPATIYVIDKKREKMQNANFPKAVMDQVPRWNRFMKVPLVKAKVGPQILTMMCDKKVFDALPVKKTVKVEVAGIYIVSMQGLKSKEELAARRGETLPWYRRLLRR